MRIPGFAAKEPVTVIRQGIQGFLDDDMMTYAAALAYSVLLALFPFLIFLLTLLGWVGLSGFFDTLLEQARVALPADAFVLVQGVIEDIRGQTGGGVLSISIVAAIWAASSGLRSVSNALNVAYNVKETRPAWQRYLLSVVYTIALALLIIAATALMLVGPNGFLWLAGLIGLSGQAAGLWSWLRWLVAIFLLLAAIALIFKVSPNVIQPLRFVTPGSVIAVAVWLLASLGFSFYVANFGNYGATYGSLGGLVVLLLYCFISAAVLLFGAEINAVIHPASSPEVDVAGTI